MTQTLPVTFVIGGEVQVPDDFGAQGPPGPQGDGADLAALAALGGRIDALGLRVDTLEGGVIIDPPPPPPILPPPPPTAQTAR